MALNLQKLTDRLKAYDDGKKGQEFARFLWKPKEGLQTVRIVPYKGDPEVPFIELKFYYNLNGKHYLAPCTFGKPDPILEMAEKLRASGAEEGREIARKLFPTPRIYVPILVRKEEDLGVRYWGFGPLVHRQLLKLTTNVKYGDITSLTEGHDIDVEFHRESKKKNERGESFPETSILPDPAITPAVSPNRKDLIEKIRDQVDILKIFPLKSYEELSEAVNQWINPGGEENGPEEPETIPQSALYPDEKASTPPVTKAEAPATSAAAAATKWEEFFNTGASA
jgi:hypothetical protein